MKTIIEEGKCKGNIVYILAQLCCLSQSSYDRLSIEIHDSSVGLVLLSCPNRGRGST